jgi:hypothetical protein
MSSFSRHRGTALTLEQSFVLRLRLMSALVSTTSMYGRMSLELSSLPIGARPPQLLPAPTTAKVD